MKSGRGLVALIVFALVGPCIVATGARATGGATIATAPTVTYGQQEFGNTATDDPNPSGCDGWWLLSVIAGDHLTIDFQGQSDMLEQLYPVGTDDFSVGNANPTKTTSGYTDPATGNSGYGQALYDIVRSGVMPLRFVANFCGGGPRLGPYNFTGYVQHELVLAVSHRTNARRHVTTVAAVVHNPDGVLITDSSLQATIERRVDGRWVAFQRRSTPFRFVVKWSRRQRGSSQALRIQVYGPGYQTTSKSVRVRAT